MWDTPHFMSSEDSEDLHQTPPRPIDLVRRYMKGTYKYPLFSAGIELFSTCSLHTIFGGEVIILAVEVVVSEEL